jgi:DNA-binding Lrp family transcriptional regulator
MLIRVLLYEVIGLSPEGKYFLARLAQYIGRDRSVRSTVRELAKLFDLSAAHVSEALTTLVASGVLVSTAVSDGRGRPKKQYSFDAGFLRRLDQIDLPERCKNQASPVTRPQSTIERLLTHEERARSDAPKDREGASRVLAGVRSRRSLGALTAVNRLLLAVLLTHADHFGVVSTLGSSALCKATGLNKGRLLNRVMRLVDQGLIRTYVAGAASTILAQKEVSTYFLNFGHPELESARHEVLTLACTSRELSEDNEFQHSYRLFEAALARQVKRAKRFYDGDSFTELVQYFEGQQVHVFKRIQLKLGDYAARLLSAHWAELTDRPRLDSSELREQIERDFWVDGSPIYAAAKTDEPGGERLGFQLGDQLYRMSLELAIDIKARLKALDAELPLDKMDYAIVPQPWGKGYLRYVLLARPRTDCAIRGCLIVESAIPAPSQEPGHETAEEMCASVKRFASESEIMLKDQYRYGMRRPPRDAVIRKPRSSRASNSGAAHQ